MQVNEDFLQNKDETADANDEEALTSLVQTGEVGRVQPFSYDRLPVDAFFFCNFVSGARSLSPGSVHASNLNLKVK